MRGGKSLGIGLEEHECLGEEGNPTKKPEEETKRQTKSTVSRSQRGQCFKNVVIERSNKMNTGLGWGEAFSLRYGGHISSIMF